MKFGSVCSGIEAASVAFNALGWEASWFSEIEPYPCALLAHHYPTVTNVSDMTHIPAYIELGALDAPDVLCGGTPCQAFSVAGLRQSLDDARGNLSLTFCEIADAIDSERLIRGEQPAIIFWENVPGVLNTKDNAFGCFLAGLAGESDALVPPGDRWTDAGCVSGPQRTVAWRVLDAQYFGLAQRRRRVFVVASAREGFDPTAVLFEFEGVRRDTAPSREAGKGIAGTVEASIGSSRGAGTSVAGVTPWPADIAPTLNAAFGSKLGLEDQHIRGGQDYLSQDITRCLSTKTRDAETETLIPTPGGHFSYGIPGNWIGRKPENGGNATEPMHDIAPCMTGADRHGVAYSVALRGRDGGATAELGDDVGFTLRASGGGGDKPHVLAPIPFDTTQITSPQNGSNPKQGDPCHPLTAQGHVPAICITGEVTHTLKAEGFDASEDGTGRGNPIVAISTDRNVWQESDGSAATLRSDGSSTKADTLVSQQSMAVRRLTPRECERLQGFPDDYTLIPVRGKPAADGPRYKALGNSWAVPVVAWIGRRIAEAIK